jgi:hypothetical protein
LIDLRPHFIYRYLYPFNDKTLFDLGYHFDYSYRDQIDDGGYYAALHRQVSAWKESQDQLYTQRTDGQVVVVDTRPVASSGQIVLDGARRLIYEYCDSMRSVAQIQQWLESRGGSLGIEQIEMILGEYVGKKLMVAENGRYLSLAVMTYTPDFELEGS